MRHDLTRKATEKNCQTKLDWTEKKLNKKTDKENFQKKSLKKTI
jgi:hypothetical protein